MKKLLFLLLLSIPAFSQSGKPLQVNGTPHGIKAAWTAPTIQTGVPVPAGYNLYRCQVSVSQTCASTSAGFASVNSTLIPSTSYLDPSSGLLTSTSYVYLVTSVDANGNESIPSNTASVVTPSNFQANPNPPGPPVLTLQ